MEYILISLGCFSLGFGIGVYYIKVIKDKKLQETEEQRLARQEWEQQQKGY